MTYLGDYLGQLMAEISMARMQADVETLRIAELYAAHPLLRTMPVPHVRLPNVDLDIPVLIKASAEPRAGESTRGGAPLAEMKRAFDNVLATTLARSHVALSAADTQRLHAALDERMTTHALPIEMSVDVLRVADDLTATALRVVGELRPVASGGEPAVSASVAAALRDAARVEFLKLRTDPPRLTVLVTSAEIREAGTGENVTRLHLKVTEEGVEWTSIETNGISRDRLVPE
jgi:hypothetical protein